MMTQEKDGKLAELLLMDAPPARDPLFRLRVLERRERQRYRRRFLVQLSAVFAWVLFSWMGASIQGGLFNTLATMVLGASLVGSYFLYAQSLGRILRGCGTWRPRVKNI